MKLPTIIQGGMGAGVSDWRLARAVSRAGQLGVVAGTGLDLILARRLQVGDPGDHVQRALGHFPLADVARRIVDRYLVPGGKAPDAPFVPLPPLDLRPSPAREELIVAANFVEVFLAREGHGGAVGVNYMEKIQLTILPSLFGAMLAGVGYVLVGAGIPRAIPAVLDEYAAARPARLRVDVRGASPRQPHLVRFDPSAFLRGPAPRLERPHFLAIVSSSTVATVLLRKASGRVDGLVLEGPTAGGHNAPPRSRAKPDGPDQAVFGERDVPDLAAVARLGVPFWIAGSCASPERLRWARRQGATGIQVGTAFAFCLESGLAPEVKRHALERIRAGAAQVETDVRASPTGFPFKVLRLPGTISEPEVFGGRERVCDLGYLRHAYLRADGRVGWRCPGEPAEAFVRKGGQVEELRGRKCVCNALMANIGLGQVRRDGHPEPPLLTSGADTTVVEELLSARRGDYTARDVLEYLLGRDPASP